VATTTVYTQSQIKRANELLQTAQTWTRGRRKADGLSLVIFPASKPGHAWYTSQLGCTCPGHWHRGTCSHLLAVQIEAKRAQESAAKKPLKTYEDLWGDDDQTVDAF
jgi:hypothetical protein